MPKLLQEYLRAWPDFAKSRDERLQQLSAQYSIAVKTHPKYPELVMFKYDQINSPMGEGIVQECRGIILNKAWDWAPVCWSFDKFFNLGEGHAAAIDWESAVYFEKLDGSLIQMYHYEGEWHVATSGMPDAGGQVFGHGLTFADLFWRTFKAQGLSLDDLVVPENDDERAGGSRDWTRFTFAWELCTPLNRVVVQHNDYRVSLIGVRDRVRGVECGVHQGPTNWPKVRAFDLKNPADLEESFKTMSPTKQEGYVVLSVDPSGRFDRVKVKNPQYVILHHIRGNGYPTPKRALALILEGEVGELLTYWPEWKPLFDEVQQRLDSLDANLSEVYDAIGRLVVEALAADVDVTPTRLQKEFASHATRTRCPSVLFLMRAGKIKSIREGLVSLGVDSVAQILHLETIAPPGLEVLTQE